MLAPTIDQLLQSALEHHQAGRLDEAEALYRQILERDPNNADALHLLGVVAHQSSRSDLAAPLIERAIALRPGVAIFHNNLGEALRALGRLDDAASAYRRALELRQDYADAHMNLGTVLRMTGRLADACAHLKRALTLRPNDADTLANLGNVLHDQGSLDEALLCYQRAVEAQPAAAAAHNNVGIVLQQLGRPAEAQDAFRRAMQLAPHYAEAQSNLLLCLHYDHGHDGPALFEEHRRWAERFESPLRAMQPPHHRSSGRPRRIGFVSPDFRTHPVAFFIEPILRHLSRDRFEVFCYSDTTIADETTRRLVSLADAWRTSSALSHEALATQVQADQIDILIDLAGHSAGNRLLTFARKPAPVQATYLGYPATTGLSAMDWRVTDAMCDPPGQTEAFHTERLMRLPDCFLCYRADGSAPAVAPSPSASSGHITFGSFNNFAKLTESMLRTWARLVGMTSGSRLLLKAKALASPSACQRVRRIMQEEGIGPERVELLRQEPSLAAHLSAYGRIDIALDTFPYCGTTTTCEALWMGVPVVTLAGPAHVSRVGTSLLHAAGCAKWVARDAQEYLQIASALAVDAAAPGMRHRLREQMAASALCDASRFARTFEEALATIWRDSCPSGPSAAFSPSGP